MHGMVNPRMPRLWPAAATAIDAAVLAIPPLWPLASSVAVNPFHGQAGEPLEVAAARLGRAAGLSVTMPRQAYTDRLTDGRIADKDLAVALAATSIGIKDAPLLNTFLR